MKIGGWMGILTVVAASGALAQAASPAAAPANGGMLQKDKPIEISSDKLDVFQDQHKAVFTGNVIAVQGTSNMRAATMTVFYRDSNAAAPAPNPTAAAAGTPQGIYRIEAEENVVFTTPTETAIGDKGIYNVDANTIDLTGTNVTLTRGTNILKGTHAVYNMDTGRSVLTAGNATVSTSDGTSKPARVHGLFVPQSKDGK